MAASPETDELSPAETKRRADAALKKMLATPPTPFTPKAKKAASRSKASTRKPKKRA